LEEKSPRGPAAELFVRREQERDPRRLFAPAEVGEHGDGDGDAGLHVEDARSAHAAVLDAKGDLRERPLGPDRVVVAQEEWAAPAFADGGEYGVAARRARSRLRADVGEAQARDDLV